MVRLNKCSNLVERSLRSKRSRASSSRKLWRQQKKKERTEEGEGREGNKVNFSNLVFYSLSILTSCQFTNEPNREISRGVFQNCGVCGQAFPLLPSPFHIFYSRSNVRAITWLATLDTHARSSVLISVTWVELLWAVFPNIWHRPKMFVCPVAKISQVMMKWLRRVSYLGRFTLSHNGRRNFWKMNALEDSANRDR